MRVLLCLFVLFLLGIHSPSARAVSCGSFPPEIEKDIKARTQAIQGTEECEHRQVLIGSIVSNQSDDYLVVYDVEDPCFNKRVKAGTPCGNFDLQYWAVYTKSRGEYHAVAASIAPKNRISIDQIKNKTILVHVYTYKPLDPNCCPSLDTLKSYKVVKDKIVESGS